MALVNNQYLIEHEYEKIIEKIKNSTIFGQPINVEDEKHLVVAAYFLGERERLLLSDIHQNCISK